MQKNLVDKTIVKFPAGISFKTAEKLCRYLANQVNCIVRYDEINHVSIGVGLRRYVKYGSKIEGCFSTTDESVSQGFVFIKPEKFWSPNYEGLKFPIMPGRSSRKEI